MCRPKTQETDLGVGESSAGSRPGLRPLPRPGLDTGECDHLIGYETKTTLN